jgi:hypothetical protein
MPNKHFCQGPACHTNPTQDRFLKSKGIIRGRYARLDVDYERHSGSYYYDTLNMDKYFCSQRCANSWLAENMECVERRTLPPFIEHRRISEGYEKAKTNWGGNTIQKIGVDNDNQ